MKQIVELYINNQKVYFSQVPNILFTYSHSDLHNPTIVKNSFSKTLTIEGTPENNRIFNNFYDLKRINSNELFNPSRKEQFVLYRNGEPMEIGYVRLDRVNKVNGKISYDITLFGGLGEFLYNLSFKESGDQMKLSDLNYSVDFNMTINKNTVYNAWKKINGVSNTVPDAPLYDVINFCPAYNGIPEDFTADKVAIDIDSFATDYDGNGEYIGNNPELRKQFKLPEGTDSSYTTVNGWIIAEMAKEYDEWQTKDLRSYLQRPVVRFKEIISACCDPNNNGGYTVDLDPDFFNESNPYYENAWMTLPLLREMEGVGDDIALTIEGDNIIIPTDTEGYVKLSINASLVASADTSAFAKDTDFLWTGIIRRAEGKGGGAIVTQYNKCYYIQVVVYDESGNVVTASPCNVFYTEIFGATDFNIEPVAETSINHITGRFDKQVNGTFVFNGQGYDLDTGSFKYERGMYAKIHIKTDIIPDLRGIDYPANALFNNISLKPWYTEAEISFGYRNEVLKTTGELGYYLNKQKILNTEKTPCDYFLSYMKMFNLHLWKDTFDDIIYIRHRKNYFTGNIVDIDDLVDKSNMNISPIIFNNKWLNLNSEVVETGVAESYKNEFGVEFGGQRIDTNYNFDTSVKELLEDTAFRTTPYIRNKSKYYVDIYQEYEDDDVYYPPYMLDGIQPFFFNSSGDTAEGIYINPKTSQVAINWWKDKYYDFMPKVLFADKENKGVEGDGVLLFYTGRIETKDVTGKKLDICITDDIPEFKTLNDDEPCWIWSMGSDVVIELDYLPCFSRYVINENAYITHSWDYGTPRMIYLPDMSIDNSSSIYGKYWQSYIRDQYDANTKKVEAKVLLNNISPEKWLRDFYYWDGRYWLLNKIIDYNSTSVDMTKCEFVSINNVSNYLQ